MRRFGRVWRLLVGLAAVAAVLVVPAVSSAVNTTPRVGMTYLTANAAGETRIWDATASGRDRHDLGPGLAASVSPNGRYVAAVGDFKNTLVVDRTTGGHQIELHLPSKYEGLNVWWSPDSRYLAVVAGDLLAPKLRQGVAVFAVPSGRRAAWSVGPGLVRGVSFAPERPDRLVYFDSYSASGLAYKGNLEQVTLAGRAGAEHGIVKSLLKDRQIAYPVWTRYGIVYSAITKRGRHANPALQLALLRRGKTTQLTHLKIPTADEGLIAEAASRNGTRLVAEYIGDATISSYVLNVVTRKLEKLRLAGVKPGANLFAGGISANGKRVLVNSGDPDLSSSKHDLIAIVPIAGGKPTVLLHGAEDPTWSSFPAFIIGPQ